MIYSALNTTRKLRCAVSNTHHSYLLISHCSVDKPRWSSINLFEEPCRNIHDSEFNYVVLLRRMGILIMIGANWTCDGSVVEILEL